MAILNRKRTLFLAFAALIFFVQMIFVFMNIAEIEKMLAELSFSI
ncbi:unnamed protein product [Oikopleura dioica]|uniref:Uncharacterized protein n=1 Tax=Oikopleura dioica TaxID=34765 RepID=E4YJ42_OIKDI|nr:unnamed protein product [Oikopleura dioica]